jgi:hypothetical protein
MCTSALASFGFGVLEVIKNARINAIQLFHSFITKEKIQT